ncbi:putative GST-like protein, partial [Echria macrotheca]
KEKMPSKLKLYITNRNYSSWSLRPWLLMKQLGIPFDEEYVELVSGSYRQPQWRSFSPVARVPCLHDFGHPENDALVLWESIAIVEHLAEIFPERRVYPAEREARAWARSAVAEMHAGFGVMREEMGMNVGLRVELGEEKMGEGLRGDLKRVGELWAEGLGRFGGPWLAGGEFGAVDAFFAPVVLRVVTFVGAEGAVVRGLDGEGGRLVRGYMERVRGLEWVGVW